MNQAKEARFVEQVGASSLLCGVAVWPPCTVALARQGQGQGRPQSQCGACSGGRPAAAAAAAHPSGAFVHSQTAPGMCHAAVTGQQTSAELRRCPVPPPPSRACRASTPAGSGWGWRAWTWCSSTGELARWGCCSAGAVRVQSCRASWRSSVLHHRRARKAAQAPGQFCITCRSRGDAALLCLASWGRLACGPGTRVRVSLMSLRCLCGRHPSLALGAGTTMPTKTTWRRRSTWRPCRWGRLTAPGGLAVGLHGAGGHGPAVTDTAQLAHAAWRGRVWFSARRAAAGSACMGLQASV